MNCPRCKDTRLELTDLRGIEVDRCVVCRGIWLDHHELDELEDKAMDQGRSKGTLTYFKRDSDIGCPKCGMGMITFNYRAHDLPIDLCEQGHGYWLDPGEDEKVLGVLRERVKDLNRSSSAEASWLRAKTVRQSKSMFSKIKDYFRR
ncbi:hypothetical protein FIM12_00375 [SAR202 cluster bacterium AD-804-J14_MRT_500m]|nr:hypothetical protein [SAR202 cluster bacterium AD-804-J14_MRT_500m]